jgi:hypothetical protein
MLHPKMFLDQLVQVAQSEELVALLLVDAYGNVTIEYTLKTDFEVPGM